MRYLDPSERLAGLRLDEEASERCACRLYPAGTLVPDEGCPMHPDAVSTFRADEQAEPEEDRKRGEAER